MPEIQIRPEVVSLLLDIEDLSAFPAEGMRHTLGEPFTAEEVALVRSATHDEVAACLRMSRAQAQMMEERHRDAERLFAIAEEHFKGLGPKATMSDVRAQLSGAIAQEWDELIDRVAPDGYFHV